MKSIILVALLCATALAVPSAPTERKTNLVEILKEQVVPKLSSLPVHKFTRANLFNLVKNDGSPGLGECVDQFIDSIEEIYNSVNRAAGRLVPLFQNDHLSEIIQTELPQIVPRVGLHASEDLQEIIRLINIFWGLSDEEAVEAFIGVGLYLSVFVIPYYTSEELYNLIRGVNKVAASEFQSILKDLFWESYDQGFKFIEVLYYAVNAVEAKH